MERDTVSRHDRAWLIGTLALATALAALDAVVHGDAALVVLLALPSILAGARLPPREAALVACYTTGLALLLGWPDHNFGDIPQVTRVGAVAGVGVLSVWIAASRVSESRARRHYSLIADVGDVLQSRLDPEVTLIEVAKLAAGELADWCFVFVKRDDGKVEQVAAVHRDPERQRMAWDLLLHYPLDPDGEEGPAKVMRTGHAELHRDVPDELLEVVAHDEENLRLLRELKLRSAIMVPLSSRDRTFGVMVFASAESGRRYGQDDLELAAELANRVATSVDSGRLYSRVIEAESDLRASRDELRAILDGVADAVTVQDRDGNLVYANDAGVKLLGAPSMEELVAKPTRETAGAFEILDENGDAFPPERLPGRLALAGEHPEPALIRFRIRDTGEERWSVVKATPILGDDGEPVLAINVIEDVTEQREREDAARFLAESSGVLSSSLDYEVTLANVARLAVPRIADWCSVDVEAEDGSIRNVAVAHADPDKVALAKELNRRYPPDPDDDQGVPNVLRTGRAELYPEIPDEMLVEGARDAEQLEALRRLELRSAMIVPMTARGRTLGTITFVSSEPGCFDEADLGVAEELATRCGIAVDNARLYRERSYIARTLQESLLPPHLPQLPGLDVAARFRAAGRGYEVGGDFYDLFDAGEGRWAAVIGDVCGKGAEAAAITALARYTLRAAAMRESNPVGVLEVLNQAILRQRSDRRFCTVLYAYLSQQNGGGVGVDFASGGHPLPILVRAGDGASEAGAPGTVIGIAQDPQLERKRMEMAPGDVLVLYTDGVTDAHAPERIWTPEELSSELAGSSSLDADAIAA